MSTRFLCGLQMRADGIFTRLLQRTQSIAGALESLSMQMSNDNSLEYSLCVRFVCCVFFLLSSSSVPERTLCALLAKVNCHSCIPLRRLAENENRLSFVFIFPYLSLTLSVSLTKWKKNDATETQFMRSQLYFKQSACTHCAFKSMLFAIHTRFFPLSLTQRNAISKQITDNKMQWEKCNKPSRTIFVWLSHTMRLHYKRTIKLALSESSTVKLKFQYSCLVVFAVPHSPRFRDEKY